MGLETKRHCQRDRSYRARRSCSHYEGQVWHGRIPAHDQDRTREVELYRKGHATANFGDCAKLYWKCGYVGYGNESWAYDEKEGFEEMSRSIT